MVEIPAISTAHGDSGKIHVIRIRRRIAAHRKKSYIAPGNREDSKRREPNQASRIELLFPNTNIVEKKNRRKGNSYFLRFDCEEIQDGDKQESRITELAGVYQNRKKHEQTRQQL